MAFDTLQLHTPRLLLRPLAAADAPALLAIHADPQVMRYWSTPPWTHIDTALALVARDQAAMAAGKHLRLGLQRHSDGELIGTCTLFDLNPVCRRAELGYGLAAASWGQGLMHEALVALLDHGFQALNLNRVEADIDPRNTASARILLRLGFVCEGLLRQRWIVGNEVSDSGLYGLLQRDWQARPAGGSMP